jgi:hypothetical protein
MNRMPLLIIAVFAALTLVIGVSLATPSIPIPPP